MNSFRLSFDAFPFLVLLCPALGLFYAYLLYKRKNAWSRRVHYTLFALRAILVTLLTFILLGPTIRITVKERENPSLALLIDNSTSLRETIDSVAWNQFYEQLKQTIVQIQNRGFDVSVKTLNGDVQNGIHFNHHTSDINGAAQNILHEYEGKNLIGLIVLSDGIYNSGISPLYTPTQAPVYTIGLGDTLQRIDINIKNVAYNKIVYQGSFFTIRVEALIQHIEDPNQEITMSVHTFGKQIAVQKKTIGPDRLVPFDFKIEAKDKGLQVFEIVVQPLPGELNIKNNRTRIYIDVVEGKKKILLIASVPHPDNKAITAPLANLENYETQVYITGLQRHEVPWKGKNRPDLVIFRYDNNNMFTAGLLDTIKKNNIPLFVMLDNNVLPQHPVIQDLLIHTEQAPKKMDIFPVVNTRYKNFTIPNQTYTVFSHYPPALTLLQQTRYPLNADVLLFCKTKSAKESDPLLLTMVNDEFVMGILLGEGIWKWRMSEFAEYGITQNFDLLFSKLVRYLSAQESHQKFRSFPVKNEFTTSEFVVFESQVYNHIFEPVYGYPIALELFDERGKARSYRYVTRSDQFRYNLGELQEGTYRYTASTILEGKKEQVEGQFRVVTQNIESRNLTADFELLKAWSKRTGGIFYDWRDVDKLGEEFKNNNAVSLFHNKTSFMPLTDMKGLFVFLLLLVTTEWVFRKFMGRY